jgi:hypothetical protein
MATVRSDLSLISGHFSVHRFSPRSPTTRAFPEPIASLTCSLPLTGALINSGTASSSFAGAVGVGTTSPSDVLAVNGPVYLADVMPAATTNRLHSSSGSLYWNGSLVGGGSVGNWSTDGTNVWRVSGSVGLGTTSPFAALSVVGSAVLTGNLTTSGRLYVSSTTANGNTATSTRTALIEAAAGTPTTSSTVTSTPPSGNVASSAAPRVSTTTSTTEASSTPQ